MEINGKINVFAHVRGEGDKSFTDLSGSISHKDKAGNYVSQNVRVRLAGELKGKEKGFKENMLYPLIVKKGFVDFEQWATKDGFTASCIVFVVTEGSIDKNGMKEVKAKKGNGPLVDDGLPF